MYMTHKCNGCWMCTCKRLKWIYIYILANATRIRKTISQTPQLSLSKCVK